MAVTQQQRDDVARLHSEGLGRNEIARQLKMGTRQVSETAEELGLTFDQKRIEKATRQRVSDNEEKRTMLLRFQLEDALFFREQLRAPCTIGQFGGRDNTWSEVKLDRPTFADQLRIQQAIVASTTNALRLLEQDAGSNRATINLVIATAEKMGLTHDGD